MARRTWLMFPLALVIFAVLASIALVVGGGVARLVLPQRPLEDRVSFNPLESYTLSDTVNGDVFFMGTDVTLTADSTVSGDVSLVGDNVTIAGRIEGDLTVIAGGTLMLDASADIAGNVLLFGDNVLIANANVGGDLEANGNHVELTEGMVRSASLIICTQGGSSDARPCQVTMLETPPPSPFTLLFSGLTFAGAAGLAVVVFPRQIGRMEDAVRRAPRRLTLVGFGVLLVASALTAVWLLLVAWLPPIGILLLPVYGIAFIMLVGLILSGWITLSLLLGDLLLRRVLRFPLPPLLEAIAGTLLLLALVVGVSLIPLVNIAAVPLVIVLTSAGVGAALSTRLGRRPLYGARLVQG